MKVFCFVAIAPFLGALASLSEPNPLGKVIDLLDELTAKVQKDGDAEEKAFKQYTAWCDDAAHNANFAVEDSTKAKAHLEATITEYAAMIEGADMKVGDLATAIASSEKDLKTAKQLRMKEAEEFSASEKELMEAVDTLGRAITVLEKELAKTPALAQLDSSSAQAVLQVVSSVVDAAGFAASDQQRLQALLQERAVAEETASGPPTAAPYEARTGGILDVLEDLKEKAEGQLSDLRKAETKAKHNFEMLRQSLEAQRAADTKDMKAQQAIKAEALEEKAGAEGDLDRTLKMLKTSTEELATTRSTCMSVAADHEATVAARAEELKVIAEARKVLTDTSSGAVSQTYAFVQLGSASGLRLQTRADLVQSEVVTAVRALARKQHSEALAQLASRIAAVERFGAGAGEDIFAKVRSMIQAVIEKLEREAAAEATEKAFCDTETAETQAKKAELEDVLAKLTTKIDRDAARSAQLKEDVRVLGSELSALAKEQAEMDQIRVESHENYVQAKKDLELGLSGVREALRVLRDYYTVAAEGQEGGEALLQQPAMPEKHTKAAGSGQSIIGILEVVESDFATNLAKEEEEEANAQTIYDEVTQENKIAKATKEQDVKYKTQESQSLDKTVGDLSSDRKTTMGELSAVLEYFGKLNERCTARPETYEQRAARRAAEIEGLKQALSILNEETAFLQRKGRRMRGSLLSVQ